MSASDIDDTFNAPPPAPSVAPSREDILNSLRWGKTQEVQTKKGPRLRTSATANHACHELFERERSELWALGYSLQEWPTGSGKWSVTRWELVPEKIVVQRQEAKAASRATNADINVPAPEGCAYLPFQRAGIAFMFQVYGLANETPSTQGSRQDANRTIPQNAGNDATSPSESGQRPDAGKSRESGPDNQNCSSIGGVEKASQPSHQKEDARPNYSSPSPRSIGNSQNQTRDEFSWRERRSSDRSGESGCKNSGADGIHPPTRDQNQGTRNGTESANVLQAGLRPPTNEDRNRTGWPVSQNDQQNRAGQQEGSGSISSRMECAEIQSSPRGCLLADEQGLGKTVQAIGLINCCPDLKRILVICPASLKLNWRRELVRWLVKPRTIFIADSKVCPAINGIVIINYDVLHKHEDVIKGTEWDMLICDEAHLCKNGKSRRSRMVVGCRASQKEKAAGMADIPGIDAKKRLLLTGTPIANRPIELYPLIHYLDPITWSSFWKYAARYTGASQENGWDTSGACNLDELQDKLRSTIMVRRLKKDVLKDLPPKTRKIVEIPANAEIRALLKQETEVYNEDEMDELETEAEFAKTSDNPEDYKKAVSALKLRTKAKFECLSTIRRELAVAKARMPMVQELLEEALEDSPKLIIFAHHKEVIRQLADKFGRDAVVIVGDTPMHERQANVDRFQKDPSCKVIIGSIGAMGVGLTLTASSHVIMMELDWVPGNVSQAEDRAHRIGQHDNVLVEHYVVEGSLDAVMAKRIIAKQNVIDQALDNITVREDADIPAPRGGTVVTFDKLAQEAALMTPKQRLAATLCIRQLAMMCNGARTHDGAGFNKLDTSIGRKLGFADTLTPKQCALARKISLKYVRQLQPDLVAQMQ